MAEPNNYITATRKNFVFNDNEGRMVEKCIIEIQGTFLEKIRNDAFNGNEGENAYEHINIFLDVVGTIKIKGLTQDQFRLNIFPVSLTGAAHEWFTKESMGSITTWDNMVEKFILKFHHLSDHNDDEEIEEEEDPNETNNAPEIFMIEGNLFDFETPLCKAFNELNYLLKINIDLFTYDIQNFKTYDEYEQEGTDEPWSENGGTARNGSGRKHDLQDHSWYNELADGKLNDETLALKTKIKGSWGDATPRIAPFTRMENFGRGPYADMKTKWGNNPHLDTNHIFERDHEASNVGYNQEDQGHKDDPIPEPSNCKVRRFEMMKYSFDDDEEYITIKESEYIKHSKDSLDAYQELLRLIDDGWVMTTPEEA
ncbi:hypothetical protein Tco_1470216 [Tanacetum coccineum]